MRKTALTLAIVSAGLFACKAEQAPTADAEKPAAEAAEETGAPAEEGHAEKAHAKGDCGDEAKADEHGEGGAAATTALTDDVAKTVERPDGTTATHVGKDFAEAAPEVSLADLLAKTDDFVGKKVRVKGNVNAMCHHKRGWFSVVSENGTEWVRVITTPTFLVPAGSVGKSAVAEGTVEIVEVKGAFVKHIAGEHKLDAEDADPDAMVKQVVIRADGADFI